MAGWIDMPVVGDEEYNHGHGLDDIVTLDHSFQEELPSTKKLSTLCGKRQGWKRGF